MLKAIADFLRRLFRRPKVEPKGGGPGNPPRPR